MNSPELEKKLLKLKQQKKNLIREFTTKAIDAINLSEQASSTHLNIINKGAALELKKKKKKAVIAKNIEDIEDEENDIDI